jgi:hypothetical protein
LQKEGKTHPLNIKFSLLGNLPSIGLQTIKKSEGGISKLQIVIAHCNSEKIDENYMSVIFIH